LRRELEPFDDEVEDRPCAAGVTGEGLKRVLHQGAASLARVLATGTS
jgi:hypothetical protein